MTLYSLQQLVAAIYAAGSPKSRKLVRILQRDKRSSIKLSDVLPWIHEAVQQSWAWIFNEICSYQWAKNNKRPISSKWLVVSSVLQILWPCWSRDNRNPICLTILLVCFCFFFFQGSCFSIVGNSERPFVQYSCECNSAQVRKNYIICNNIKWSSLVQKWRQLEVIISYVQIYCLFYSH